MIRHLELDLYEERSSRPPWNLRVLAVSDEPEPGLEQAAVREQLGRLDLIVGCGDLEAPYLAMLADAFVAPLLFVRGNHDRGNTWDERSRELLPLPLPDARPVRFGPIDICGLSWPAEHGGRAIYDPRAAWGQAIPVAFRTWLRRRPLLMVSHVPPLGLGDVEADRYHRGFGAYRWLIDRIRPAAWLHGHTHPASGEGKLFLSEPLPVVNVTGAVLIDLTA